MNGPSGEITAESEALRCNSDDLTAAISDADPLDLALQLFFANLLDDTTINHFSLHGVVDQGANIVDAMNNNPSHFRKFIKILQDEEGSLKAISKTLMDDYKKFVMADKLEPSCPNHQLASIFEVYLDQDAKIRWKNIVEIFKKTLRLFIEELEKEFGDEIQELDDKNIGSLDNEYRQEMIGIAEAIDKPVESILLANILYELNANGRDEARACTSIIVELVNDVIFHGRNLDYHYANVLRELTIIVDFYDHEGGEILYTGTTFAGMVGLLTVMKPNGFTITLNERYTGARRDTLADIAAGNHTINTLHIRNIANQCLYYEDAVYNLAYGEDIVAPCYFIVGGLGQNQGAVITRDRKITDTKVWQLNLSNRQWFLVQTNHDVDHSVDALSPRRNHATKKIREKGHKEFLARDLVDVLFKPPVYNCDTVYTVLMSASFPFYYQTWVWEKPSWMNFLYLYPKYYVIF